MGGTSPEMGPADGGEAGRRRWRRPVAERGEGREGLLRFYVYFRHYPFHPILHNSVDPIILKTHIHRYKKINK